MNRSGSDRKREIWNLVSTGVLPPYNDGGDRQFFDEDEAMHEKYRVPRHSIGNRPRTTPRP